MENHNAIYSLRGPVIIINSVIEDISNQGLWNNNMHSAPSDAGEGWFEIFFPSNMLDQIQHVYALHARENGLEDELL